MSKVWFVTGGARGLGRAFVDAALSRGDSVAAAARDTSMLRDLEAAHGARFKAVALDVTDRGAVFAAVAEVERHFQHIDVAVNNAGYGHFAAFEELSEEDLRRQLETNLFGAVWVSQAVLPGMRARGSGHVVQVSSVGGLGAWPTLSAYHASKWALEGMSEALAGEVAAFGVRVTLVEPSDFRTDWSGSSARHSERLADYDFLRASSGHTHQPGDPAAAAKALLEVVDSPAPPLRVLFGEIAPSVVKEIYAQRLAAWAEWEDVTLRSQGSAG